MAFCTKCGNQIPDDSAFCTSCGQPTNSSQKEQTNNAAPTFTPPAENKSAPTFTPPAQTFTPPQHRHNGPCCYYHSDDAAVARCARCGKNLCKH